MNEIPECTRKDIDRLEETDKDHENRLRDHDQKITKLLMNWRVLIILGSILGISGVGIISGITYIIVKISKANDDIKEAVDNGKIEISRYATDIQKKVIPPGTIIAYAGPLKKH